MHSEQINFRASPAFTSVLARLAMQEGVSRSELLRRAVLDRAELAGTEPPPLTIVANAPAEQGLHARASRGEGDAFAELAALHYGQAVEGIEPPPIALAKAIVFGRLAVLARDTREDLVSFLFLLDQQADALRGIGLVDLADRHHAEAVTIAEGMAEDGDEEIAQMIVSSASQLTPASLNIARDMREAVKETIGC